MDLSREMACERRRYARLDMALAVSYVVRDRQGRVTESAEAQSLDVSASGIRLMSPAPLGNGARIDLEIGIEGHDEQTIRATGEVVWQSPISPTSYETGIVIRYIEDDDKKRFLGFVFSQMTHLMGLHPHEVH